MIKINDTNNMIGITIHGDYEDLKTLHHALSDYLRFYFDHQEGSSAYSCYETILGLCYDIRHAYQGDRNIETVENNHENIAQLASCIYQLDEKSIEKERKKYKNGNLYFNVEVLYPWAVFYLFALQAVAEDVYHHEWFENDEYGYTEYQAESDLALIRYFVHLLWGRLRDHLPEDVLHVLWDYTRIYNHVEYYFGIPDMYMEWLCTYWINAFCNKLERHDMLPLLCLELSSILDEYPEDLEPILAETEKPKKNAPGKTGDINRIDNTANGETADRQAELEKQFITLQASIAQNTLQGLDLYDRYFALYTDGKPGNKISYLSQDEFMDVIYSHVCKHGQFTEESYEEWLDQQLGEVAWDRLEW